MRRCVQDGRVDRPISHDQEGGTAERLSIPSTLDRIRTFKAGAQRLQLIAQQIVEDGHYPVTHTGSAPDSKASVGSAAARLRGAPTPEGDPPTRYSVVVTKWSWDARRAT